MSYEMLGDWRAFRHGHCIRLGAATQPRQFEKRILTMATINTTKKQSAIETTTNGLDLTLTFSDGRELIVRMSKLSDEIQRQAILHGLKQKLCDAAAISRDPVTGRAATIDTKYDAVKEVFDRLMSIDATWNKQREAGAGGSGGLLLASLARMYAGRKTKEDLRTFLDGKSLSEQAALRKNPRVAEIIEEIKAERAKDDDDGADSDEMLSELED